MFDESPCFHEWIQIEDTFPSGKKNQAQITHICKLYYITFTVGILYGSFDGVLQESHISYR